MVELFSLMRKPCTVFYSVSSSSQQILNLSLTQGATGEWKLRGDCKSL